MMNIPLFLHHTRFDTSAIKTIPLGIFSFILCVFTMFSLYFLYQWYKNFIRARTIEDKPTSKIRSAAQGYVELQGIQKFFEGKPTIARLSKLPCTWYRYTIEYQRGNKWTPIEQGISHEFFVLEDETGMCVINPNGAQITASFLDTWQGFSRYPQCKPGFFGRLIGTLGRYRYQEWRMEDGMSLYAIGNFHTISDDNKNTFIHVLSNDGLSSRDPFVLSARTQQKLIWMFKRDAFIWFLAFSILFILIAWLFTIRFG